MLKFAVFALLIASVAALPRSTRRVPGGGKIVGGIDAKEGEFPYQLALYWNRQFICGASIISERFALTAAHCVEGDPPSAIQVTAGKHLRLTTGIHEQTKQVSRIVVHANYNGNTFANDIALLELSTPFVFNDFVQPAPLPEAQQQTNGLVVVSGWGATRQGGLLANILQYVDVPVVPDAECQKNYPGETILPSMICAGVPAGGKDSCQGDSGGPLVAREGGYLGGIVSWGYGCAQAGYPGVYTEVSYFIDWISEQMLI